MDLAAIRKFCATLPGTTEDVKWGADLCFCVGKKMYAVTGLPDGEPPTAITLKVPPTIFADLVKREGIEPAPYLARHHWVLVNDGAMKQRELEAFIRGSYEEVFAKLPRKLQREITG